MFEQSGAGGLCMDAERQPAAGIHLRHTGACIRGCQVRLWPRTRCAAQPATGVSSPGGQSAHLCLLCRCGLLLLLVLLLVALLLQRLVLQMREVMACCSCYTNTLQPWCVVGCLAC
jgi:hypothetical protein